MYPSLAHTLLTACSTFGQLGHLLINTAAALDHPPALVLGFVHASPNIVAALGQDANMFAQGGSQVWLLKPLTVADALPPAPRRRRAAAASARNPAKEEHGSAGGWFASLLGGGPAQDDEEDEDEGAISDAARYARQH